MGRKEGIETYTRSRLIGYAQLFTGDRTGI